MIRYSTGVDLISSITRAVVGDPVGIVEQKPYNDYWAEVILHSEKDGVFQSVDISPDFPGDVVEQDLWVRSGDAVSKFMGANNAIGTLVLRFKDQETMESIIMDQSRWLTVVVR